jgi:hypothetical protein
VAHDDTTCLHLHDLCQVGQTHLFHPTKKPCRLIRHLNMLQAGHQYTNTAVTQEREREHGREMVLGLLAMNDKQRDKKKKHGHLLTAASRAFSV